MSSKPHMPDNHHGKKIHSSSADSAIKWYLDFSWVPIPQGILLAPKIGKYPIFTIIVVAGTRDRITFNSGLFQRSNVNVFISIRATSVQQLLVRFQKSRGTMLHFVRTSLIFSCLYPMCSRKVICSRNLWSRKGNISSCSPQILHLRPITRRKLV